MKDEEQNFEDNSIFNQIESIQKNPVELTIRNSNVSLLEISNKILHSFKASFCCNEYNEEEERNFFLTRNYLYTLIVKNNKKGSVNQFKEEIRLRNCRIIKKTKKKSDENEALEISKEYSLSLIGYKGRIYISFSALQLMEESYEKLRLVCIQKNINDYYFPGKVLGEGGFSVVFLGTRISDKKKFAVKSINKIQMEKSIDGLVNLNRIQLNMKFKY